MVNQKWFIYSLQCIEQEYKLSKERSGKNVEVTIIGSFKQRKSVIRGDDPVFNATPVFLPVIPVFVVTKGKHWFWTGGRGSGISGGYDYCRWSCHPCA